MIKTLEPLQDSKSLSPMSRRFTVIRNDIPYNITMLCLPNRVKDRVKYSRQ